MSELTDALRLRATWPGAFGVKLLAISENERDAILTALERAGELARIVPSHYGHWDSTGRAGAGCPQCHEEREAAHAVRVALANEPAEPPQSGVQEVSPS